MPGINWFMFDVLVSAGVGVGVTTAELTGVGTGWSRGVRTGAATGSGAEGALATVIGVGATAAGAGDENPSIERFTIGVGVTAGVTGVGVVVGVVSSIVFLSYCPLS